MTSFAADAHPPKPTTRTGVDLFRVVLSPSRPFSLLPQQDMVPFRWSAQECLPPALMAVASVMPVTCTGTELSRFVPLTSCPYPLWPQQDMVPSRWRAQEWLAPVVMAVASVMLKTWTGTGESAFLPLCPLPSCPLQFLPQQDMVPFWWSAQVDEMAVASVMPVTCTGTELLRVVPLPSRPSRLSPQHDMVPPRRRAQE